MIKFDNAESKPGLKQKMVTVKYASEMNNSTRLIQALGLLEEFYR